jgi:hypothetical protein
MIELIVDAATTLALVREVVARGGVLELRVHGSSMYPNVADGDRVVLGRASGRPGAVVLANVEGAPMLHRLLRTCDGSAELSADACGRRDRVPLANVSAEVYAVRRSRPRWSARLRWWLSRRYHGSPS